MNAIRAARLLVLAAATVASGVLRALARLGRLRPDLAALELTRSGVVALGLVVWAVVEVAPIVIAAAVAVYIGTAMI